MLLHTRKSSARLDVVRSRSGRQFCVVRHTGGPFAEGFVPLRVEVNVVSVSGPLIRLVPVSVEGHPVAPIRERRLAWPLSLSAHITARCGSSHFCVCHRYLSVFRWKSSRICSRLTAPHGGITLSTRVYGSQHYTLQQSQAGASSSSLVQTLASAKESIGTASSSFVSSPQLPHSAISSQVLAGPTRNVTGDVMSDTLAEAATQLSCAEFLERCNLLRAPPPRPQPNPTLLLDAATQTFPLSAASAEVSTQLPLAEFFLGCIYPEDPLDYSAPPPAHGKTCPTCSRPIPSLLLDAAAQTPSHTVSLLPMPPPNYRSRSLFSGASTPMNLWIARSNHRHMVMPAAPHFPNPLTSPLPTVPAAPAAPVIVMFAPRLHARGSTLRHRRHQVSRIKPT